MNKRTSLAHSLKYQRRHYHGNPHPKDKTIRDRNVTCMMRAARAEGVRDFKKVRPYLEAIDAMPKDYQPHHQPLRDVYVFGTKVGQM